MWKIWLKNYTEWKNNVEYKKESKFLTLKEKDLSYEALVLSYLYPRLDANVSTGINHLLKSPFCVHPKTGNICVPFDSSNVENFKLSEVPTLTKVINELGNMPRSSIEMQDDIVNLPSLTPYINIFKKHIRACIVK